MDKPMPCPVCGGAFLELASHGAITCENGHDFTMRDLPEAMALFEELMRQTKPFSEADLPDYPPYCPFSGDGECPGDCPSNRERACVNGP